MESQARFGHKFYFLHKVTIHDKIRRLDSILQTDEQKGNHLLFHKLHTWCNVRNTPFRSP